MKIRKVEKQSAQLLADILLNAPSVDLRNDIANVLTELIRGNVAPANERLAAHATPARLAVMENLKDVRSPNHDSVKIRVGNKTVYFVEEQPDSATAEQLAYSVLRRAIKTGAIAHLTLCEQCDKLFYRKSLKRMFCTDKCRFKFYNDIRTSALSKLRALMCDDKAEGI